MRRMRIVLVLAAVLTALTGCRSNMEVTVPTVTAGQTVPSTQETTRPTTQPTSAPTEPAFEERVLVETEDVLVKLTGIVEDPVWGYTLKVYLENRTDDNLMFSVEDAAVNGFMCDPFWAAEVREGMKANEEISFFKSDFEANGITEVADIVFTLHVYDSDDWEKEDYVNQTVTIQP